MTPLHHFNTQPAAQSQQALLACCHSTTWAQTLTTQRPYPSIEALIQASTTLWFTLPEQDWLQAFAAHPRIGESRPQATTFLAYSQTEQAATQDTLLPVAERLLLGNRAYEEKFGFLYIVFAAGRTAPELLSILEERLTHTRAEELHEAARQQDKITQLRLRKWLQP